MLVRNLGIGFAMLVGAASAWGQGKTDLGQLGQAIQPTAIYASKSTRSHKYYRLKAYEYIIVQGTESSRWYAVLLQNGAFGYVSTDKVARLPYRVTSARRPRAMTASVPSANSGAGDLHAWAARAGLQYIGTPYKWGGEDMQNGVDCSAFVQNLYGKVGERLPRTAAEQANVGTPITRLEYLRPGDRLYFWENKRGKIGHTGIYIGGGYFVHSSSGNHGVATDYLGEKRWLRLLVAARR